MTKNDVTYYDTFAPTVPLLGIPSGEYFDLEISKVNFLKQKGIINYSTFLKSWIFKDKDYKEIIKHVKDDRKEQIKKFMSKIGVDRYRINSDYTLDVLEDVKIRIRMTEIPVKFDYVMGDFDISAVGLLDLNGCPEIVEGDFICVNNLINDLRGGPKKVGGNYIIKECGLSSLVGAPEKIKGDFVASMNNINDLVGGPKIVDGSYYVDNCLLMSLEGAPDLLSGNFDCSSNLLEDLKDGPDLINGMYDCSNNDLKTLKNGPHMVKIFKCNGNKKLKDLQKYAPLADKIISDEI